MNNSRWVGLSIGTLFLIGTLFMFGSSVHDVWYRIPVDAIDGLALTLAFGLGFDHILAYIAALITLVALFYLGYTLGHRVHNKLQHEKDYH